MDDAGVYGGYSDLVQRDKTIHDFRDSDKDTKRKIIEKMLTLRHNMKYNKHLLSVYMKAKGLFDTMIEEHRAQLHYLDEIYRHLNHLIRENLSAQKNNNKNNKNAGTNTMMNELIKDKKRIGALLKKMRNSFNKLMDIDTVIGVTIAQINEITFMEDHDQIDPKDDEDEGEADNGAEDEDEDAEDDDEDAEDEDAEDDDEDDEDDEEGESIDDESDSEPDDEDEDEAEEEADEAEEEGEEEGEEGEPIDDESDSEPEDEDDSDSDSDSEDDEAQNSIYLF
jgi:hypothetical protein